MRRKQNRRAGWFSIAALVLLLTMTAPSGAFAAQLDEATPIPGVPPVTGNEPDPADTATGTDGDVSAAAIDGAYFGQDTYFVSQSAGSTVLVTLVIKMGSITTSGAFSIPSAPAGFTFAFVSATPSGPGVTCTGAENPGGQISGTFTNARVGPAMCELAFTVTSTGLNTDTSIFASVSWDNRTQEFPLVELVTAFTPVTTATFDKAIYTGTVGDPIPVTLTIGVPAGSVGSGTVNINLQGLAAFLAAVPANVSGVADGGGSCSAVYASLPSAAIVASYTTGAGAFTCTVSFTLTFNDWPADGGSAPMNVEMFPPAGSAAAPSARISLFEPSTEVLALGLSTTTAFPGDVVTVTATQAYSVSGSSSNPSNLQVILPEGVTLLPGTIEFDCPAPACSNPQVTNTSTSVLATHTSARPELYTVTLQFDVQIDDPADPGSSIDFEANGEVLAGTTSARRTGPATASLTMLQGLGTSDFDLDVAYAGDVEGTISASGGTPGYTFAVQDQPGLGQVVLDSGTGHFTYSADDFATGSDVFTALVTDSRTPVPQTAMATVHVVIADPAPLTTTPLTIQGIQGETVNGRLAPQVTGGMPPYAFAVQSQPLQGELTINAGGSFSYAGNSDASGTDVFVYSVTDGAPVATAAVVTGEVTITFAALPPTSTATATSTSTATATATATATVAGTAPPTATPSPTATIDPGAPPARPTSTATSTPTAVSGGSGNGVTTLPNTGSGDSQGGSMLLLVLGGVLVMLVAGRCSARKRNP